MNLRELDKQFQTSSELEIVRLLTCNFNLANFSLLEKNFDGELLDAIHTALDNPKVLELQPTTLDGFIAKMKYFATTSGETYSGQALKVGGWSGHPIQQAVTLLGTPGNFSSHNEYFYVLKMYPWRIQTINPVFQTAVDLNDGTPTFYCLDTFDLSILNQLEDVKLVTDDTIVMSNKQKIKIVVVDSL